MKIVGNFSVCVIALTMLAACSGTWKIQESASPLKEEALVGEMAIIERQEGRHSPKIKTFKHIDLGIHKESGGSRSNILGAPNRVETPPGKVQIGVTFLPFQYWIYYPEVEFNAAPGHKYWITWVCNPYPYVVIVGAESSIIEAVDTFCQNCDELLGATLLPSTECSKNMTPLVRSGESTISAAGSWVSVLTKESHVIDDNNNIAQMYRNLCYAAEHDVTAASMQLAMFYHHGQGIYKLQQDTVLAYVWYRFAARSGDELAIRYVKQYEEDFLSPEQLKRAQNMFGNWELGQCEKQVFESLQLKHKLQIVD